MQTNINLISGKVEDYTILAVPCDQLVILSREEAENIRATYNANRKTKEEREQLSREVKALFTKPGKK